MEARDELGSNLRGSALQRGRYSDKCQGWQITGIIPETREADEATWYRGVQ